MKTIVLVPCSSKKKQTTKPVAAKDLYIGPFFKKAMECAESMKPDKIFILSAKHHLVELDKKLSCYNMKLDKQPVKYRREWADKVLRQLKEKGVDLKNDKLVFLTGKPYYEDLLPQIKKTEIIGEGLRIGLKMQEFNRRINNKKNES